MSLRGPMHAAGCWFLLLVAPFPLSGQERTLHANRTTEQPTLSSEASWADATVITDFKQREPFEGTPASEKTVVQILYDRRYLYIRAHCFDSAPKRIVATELRRDADLSVDDNFTILLSPNNDGRSGYEFTVNPLGTQYDALIAEEGKVNDLNWDGIWSSDAKMVGDGWIATITIPFSTLNFRASEDQTVGINFRRFIRRKNEEDLWRSYLRIYGLERISQGGELSDLQEIGSGRLLVVKPYVLGGVRNDSATGTHALHTAGLDLKYGLRSNLVANLTVNTDFADADVDPQQLNLTPFRIFIPEKRPFFLENSGIFQFGDREATTLFFSRQIGIDPVTGEQVPLDVGAKLTGVLGGVDLGILEAKTRESGLNPGANYVVARLKRKLFSESYIGAIAIDKQRGSPTDPYTRAEGLDANFVFLKKFALSGFAAKTESSQSTLRGHDWAVTIDATYNSNLIQAEALRAVVKLYSRTGPVLGLVLTKFIQQNFNPEVGFVDRTDLVTNLLDFQLAPLSGSYRKKPSMQNWTKFWGQAIGYGIMNNISDAYIYLMNRYESGDRIFLFGFSRGAYTARAIAAMLHMVGLVRTGNEVLVPYVTKMFQKRHKDRSSFILAAEFKNTFSHDCKPYFVGVWDTVSSVGWIYDPVSLPYTAYDPDLTHGRHALSVDERRCFFRQNMWVQKSATQDIKQLWFAGVHSDVGGGYPEDRSGLAKIALQWMVDQATTAGLLIDQTEYEQVLGSTPGSGFARPDAKAELHDSMCSFWPILEFFPHRWVDLSSDRPVTKWEIPHGRHRYIPENSILHATVIQRIKAGVGYQPPNLPKTFTIQGMPTK